MWPLTWHEDIGGILQIQRHKIEGIASSKCFINSVFGSKLEVSGKFGLNNNNFQIWGVEVMEINVPILIGNLPQRRMPASPAEKELTAPSPPQVKNKLYKNEQNMPMAIFE
jgi:hypothetical protein